MAQTAYQVLYWCMAYHRAITAVHHAQAAHDLARVFAGEMSYVDTKDEVIRRTRIADRLLANILEYANKERQAQHVERTSDVAEY